jgi:hypothetical protein
LVAEALEEEVALTVLGRLRQGAAGFGRALRPAVPPLAKGIAYGGATVLGLGALGSVLDSFGHVLHPPGQVVPIDTDPRRPGPESVGFYDPVTGRLVTYGAPPADKGNADRSTLSLGTWLIIGGATVLVVVAITKPWK